MRPSVPCAAGCCGASVRLAVRAQGLPSGGTVADGGGDAPAAAQASTRLPGGSRACSSCGPTHPQPHLKSAGRLPVGKQTGKNERRRRSSALCSPGEEKTEPRPRSCGRGSLLAEKEEKSSEPALG